MFISNSSDTLSSENLYLKRKMASQADEIRDLTKRLDQILSNNLKSNDKGLPSAEGFAKEYIGSLRKKIGELERECEFYRREVRNGGARG